MSSELPSATGPLGLERPPAREAGGPFDFDRLPFELAPDADFLFWAEGHRRAAECLEAGLARRAPVTLLTGEIGAGKTTILQNFLASPRPDLTLGLLPCLGAGGGDVWALVLLAFRRPLPEGAPPLLIAAVQAFAAAEREAGRRCVLVVDEAQCATDDELEALRRLTTIDAGRHATLQIVLVGQPALRERLREDRHAPLAARIGADAHLPRMGPADTAGYVRHRLLRAGGRDDLFTPGALVEVHELAGGVARATNMLCDLCLAEALRTERSEVDRPLVRGVVAAARQSGTFAGLVGAGAAAGTHRPATGARNDDVRPRDASASSGPPTRRPSESAHRASSGAGQPPSARTLRSVHMTVGGARGTTPDRGGPSGSPESSAAEHAPPKTTPSAANRPAGAAPTPRPAPRTEATAAMTPRPGDTSAATPEPTDAAAATPKPGDAAAVAPELIGAAAATPKPGDAAALAQKPDDAAAATPEPGNAPATPGVAAAVTPDPTDTAAEAVPGVAAAVTPEPGGAPASSPRDPEAAEAVRQLAFSAMASLADLEPAEGRPRQGTASGKTSPRRDRAGVEADPARPPAPGGAVSVRPGRRLHGPALVVASVAIALVTIGFGYQGLWSAIEAVAIPPTLETSAAAGEAAPAEGSGPAPVSPDAGTAGRSAPKAPRPAPKGARLTTPALPTVAAPDVSTDGLYALALDLALVDPETAAIAFARAASRGHDRAAYYLAQLYETGDGVPRNLALARAWYLASGLPRAEPRLAALQEVPRNGELAPPRLLSAARTSEGMLELVWTAAGDGSGIEYEVELFDGAGGPPLLSERLAGSALRLPAPARELFWRVTAEDASAAATSGLQRIPAARHPDSTRAALP